MTLLSDTTLESLNPSVAVPRHNRRALTSGILHVSVGGFHRAHHAMYVDRFPARGRAPNWGICGVGLLVTDSKMREVIRAQDCLYTLVLKHPDGRWEPKVVGSILEYLIFPDQAEAVIERLATTSTCLVSLTIRPACSKPSGCCGIWGCKDTRTFMAKIRAEVRPGAKRPARVPEMPLRNVSITAACAACDGPLPQGRPCTTCSDGVHQKAWRVPNHPS